jgi:hypothetical protein
MQQLNNKLTPMEKLEIEALWNLKKENIENYYKNEDPNGIEYLSQHFVDEAKKEGITNQEYFWKHIAPKAGIFSKVLRKTID